MKARLRVWAGAANLSRTWWGAPMCGLGVALATASALAVTVEPLPQSGYADTEVSTNFHYEVTLTNVTRMAFVIELEATPTNNVEVSIGTDGNGDGSLAVEEAAYVFGYDCGKWFRRTQSKSEIEVEQWNLATCSAGQPEQGYNHHCTTTTPDYDLSSHTFILKKRNLDTAWDTVKVTRRGYGDVGELLTVEGRYPGFKLEIR